MKTAIKKLLAQYYPWLLALAIVPCYWYARSFMTIQKPTIWVHIGNPLNLVLIFAAWGYLADVISKRLWGKKYGWRGTALMLAGDIVLILAARLIGFQNNLGLGG